jgi:hypothetical protein
MAITNTLYSYSNMPHDIALEIFSRLSPEECALAGAVCKSWNQLSNQEIIWKGFAQSIGMVCTGQKDFKKNIIEYFGQQIIVTDNDSLLLKVENYVREFINKNKATGSLALKFESYSNRDVFLYTFIDLDESAPHQKLTSEKEFQVAFFNALIKKVIIGKGNADFTNEDLNKPDYETSFEKLPREAMVTRNWFEERECVEVCILTGRKGVLGTSLGFRKRVGITKMSYPPLNHTFFKKICATIAKNCK